MQAEKEITFIDLLVVIIKHRRLIIGVPLFATLLTGIVLFALPIFGILSFGSYTIQASTVTSRIPPVLESELGIDSVTLAIIYARDVPEVTDSVVRNGLSKPIMGDKEGWLFRTYIARSFIGQRYRVLNRDGLVIFELVTKEPEAGQKFLSEMIAYTEKRLRSEITKRASIIADSMFSLLSSDAGTNTSLTEASKQLLIASYPYRAGVIPALVDTNRPVVLINSQSRVRKTLIVVLASLFFSVFLAFVLDYIERVKNDPEASAKVREALGK